MGHHRQPTAAASSKALLQRPLFQRVRGQEGRMLRGPKLDYPENVYPMSLSARVVALD